MCCNFLWVTLIPVNDQSKDERYRSKKSGKIFKKCCEIAMKIKVHIFLAVLCETWPIRLKNVKKLSIFNQSLTNLRRISNYMGLIVGKRSGFFN